MPRDATTNIGGSTPRCYCFISCVIALIFMSRVQPRQGWLSIMFPAKKFSQECEAPNLQSQGCWRAGVCTRSALSIHKPFVHLHQCSLHGRCTYMLAVKPLSSISAPSTCTSNHTGHILPPSRLSLWCRFNSDLISEILDVPSTVRGEPQVVCGDHRCFSIFSLFKMKNLTSILWCSGPKVCGEMYV